VLPEAAGPPGDEPLDVVVAPWPLGRPLRVAAVGVGGVVSYAHLPAYRRLGARVTALVDVDDRALAEAARLVGGDPPARYRDLAGFTREIEITAPDFVDISTPSATHAAVVLELLDRLGPTCPPLLVQKPLAVDPGDAHEVLDRASGLGVRVGVNLTGRYVPTFRVAQAALASGAVGEPTAATVLNQGWNPKDGREWRARLDRLIILEMAIHHIDLLCWMLGPAASVTAASARVGALRTAGENVAHLLIEFRRGTFATVVEDWASREPRAARFHPTAEELVVTGTDGTMWCTPTRLSVTGRDGSTEWESTARWFPDAFAGSLAEFAAAVATGRPSELDARDHVHTLDLIDAAYRSLADGDKVPVPARSP
jgi:predicted dehydrogenase